MFTKILALIRNSQIGKCKCKHVVITNEVRYYCYQCGKILIK
jgi:hypothetical protein